MLNAEHICLSSVKTRVGVRLTSNLKLWHPHTRKMMAFINDLCRGRDKAFIIDLCHKRDFFYFSIFFCRRQYKMKFDIDPGYIFRLLLQFHSRKLNTM